VFEGWARLVLSPPALGAPGRNLAPPPSPCSPGAFLSRLRSANGTRSSMKLISTRDKCNGSLSRARLGRTRREGALRRPFYSLALLAACSLSPHLVGRLVLAQADVNRVPQEVVGRPGQIRDLGNQPWLDPTNAKRTNTNRGAAITRSSLRPFRMGMPSPATLRTL
jgi:hypothetical protein